MWIATRHGFFSLALGRDKGQPVPHIVMIRARCSTHLQRLAAAHPEIEFGDVHHDAVADYPYRFVVDRTTIAPLMPLLLDGVDYPNFKAAVENDTDDPDYLDFLHRVWAVGRSMLDDRP